MQHRITNKDKPVMRMAPIIFRCEAILGKTRMVCLAVGRLGEYYGATKLVNDMGTNETKVSR